MVYLTAEQWKRLDEISRIAGENASTIIRLSLDFYYRDFVGKQKELTSLRTIADEMIKPIRTGELDKKGKPVKPNDVFKPRKK